MNSPFRKALADKIIAGASIHRVAVRIIAEIKPHSRIYRLVASHKLAFIYQMPLESALAIIEEMDDAK